MAKRFLSDIHATAGLKDSSGDLGSDGQVLSSTGAGTNWVQAGSGATVIYDDQFTATANQTVFTLSNTVDAENKTQVYIDGAYQAKAGYTVSGTTLTFDTGLAEYSEVEVITFATAIASNAAAVIRLDEFTGDNSTTDFALAQGVTDEKVTQVYINGVYQHKDTYSITDVTLTFSTAPPTSADIEVITFDTLSSSGEIQASSTALYVKNTSGSTIDKGTPVYITGSVGNSNTLTISPANASNASHMPSTGLLLTTLANNSFGYIITNGFLKGLTTNTIDGTSTSSNDTIYVKAGGGLTMTKPTGTNLIQNIGKVARSSGGNSGSILVSSILRSNDVPNIASGKIWVGDSNAVATERSLSGDATLSNTGALTLGTVPITKGGTGATSASAAKTALSLDNLDNTSDANKPVSTAGQAALDLKANIAGPTFTGTPAAPTASAGTNTTQLATTAFVTTGIANIVDSAPGALNTLNELAAALGDDANFSTTVTNSIATKAPLASPTFTGNATFSGKSDITTSVSGFASTITNNKDDSQGLLVRTSDNDGGEYILDLQSSSSATGTNYSSKFKVAKGGDATFSGSVSLADTKYIQLNNTSTDWRLRADNAGRFVIQTSGGSEFFKISSGGNVGIGTSGTPTRKLQVLSGASSDIASFGNDSGSFTFGQSSALTSLDLATSNAFRIRQGSVVPLSISSGGEATFTNKINIGSGTNHTEIEADGLYIRGTQNGFIFSPNDLNFYAGSSPRLTISSGGQVFMNTTSSIGTGVLSIKLGGTNKALGIRFRAESDGNYATAYENSSGTIVGKIIMNASSTSYVTTSDYRLKENVTPITDALSRINQLKPSRFNFITDADKIVDGFIAHEVQDIVPEAISGEKDAMRDEEFELTPRVEAVIDEEGNLITEAVEAVMETRSVPDYQGIDQSKIVPLLTAAIQEQQTIIEDLKSRIETLEG